MSSIGSLYTFDGQPQGKRIRAIAGFGGLTIDLPSFKPGVDNQKPEYTSKFASGKMPAFEDKDGFTLFETAAISRYVAGQAPNSTLLGASAKEEALVDQWVSFADSEINAHTFFIFAMLKNSSTPYERSIHDALTQRQLRSFGTLEKHLSSRKFLVTEHITLADITMAAVLRFTFQVTFDAPLRKQHPNIIKFYERVTDHPKIKEAFGEPEYVEKALEYTPPEKKDSV